MSDESVILINLLKVKPGKRDALIAAGGLLYRS
jgi:hypothetical protein